MNILAIESATDILSVAVACPRGRSEASIDAGLRHAESLMRLVDSCMAGLGLSPRDLELVACSQGPGSFTGLRIGMATAKGIAEGLGIPWKAVPSLDCLAWGLEHFSGAVAPIIDGKRGRVYSAIYHRGLRQGSWLDLPLAELAALLDTYPEALATGPDAELFAPYVQDRPGFGIDRRCRFPAALALAALAEESYLRDGPTASGEGPLYLRPSEAEETAAGARPVQG